MQRLLTILVAAAVLIGVIVLLNSPRPGPTPAAATTTPPPLATAAHAAPAADLVESHPQFAALAELVPIFTSVQRVQLLNLLNGLWLTDDQLDEIIGILGEQQRLEQRYLDVVARIEANRPEINACRGLLGEVRAVLLTGEQPSPELSTAANEAVTGLMHDFSDFEGLEEDLKAYQSESRDAIFNLLTANQRVLVHDYVECIIPPVGDPNNPERIGQATGEAEQHMANLRALSAEEYDRAKDHIVGEIWQFIIKHFPDEQQGVDSERARIAAALDAVRALDEEEFRLHPERAVELVIPYELHPKPAVDAGGTYNEEFVRNRVYKFFIENNPVEMLREYREQRDA